MRIISGKLKGQQIAFLKKRTPIRKIAFTPKLERCNVILFSEMFDDRPDAVGVDPQDQANRVEYKYLNIFVYSDGDDDFEFEDGVDELLEVEAGAEIEFNVDRSWLTENSIDEDSIMLRRFLEDTNEWQDLDTVLLDNGQNIVVESFNLIAGQNFITLTNESALTPEVLLNNYLFNHFLAHIIMCFRIYK